jgi:hypothetical protein
MIADPGSGTLEMRTGSSVVASWSLKNVDVAYSVGVIEIMESGNCKNWATERAQCERRTLCNIKGISSDR